MVDEPLKDASGNPIEVPYRVDMKTGKPRVSSSKGRSGNPTPPEPDAVYIEGGEGVIIDDKPVTGKFRKYKQQLAREIMAYEKAYGKKPRLIGITWYDPATGEPLSTQLFKPSDIAPFLG